MNLIGHWVKKIWTTQKVCTKSLTHWHTDTLTHEACSHMVFPNGRPKKVTYWALGTVFTRWAAFAFACCNFKWWGWKPPIMTYVVGFRPILQLPHAILCVVIKSLNYSQLNLLPTHHNFHFNNAMICCSVLFFFNLPAYRRIIIIFAVKENSKIAFLKILATVISDEQNFLQFGYVSPTNQ